MPEVVVASWNVHSGVDGWGRPFDVLGGCRAIDADVLVLEETWTLDGGSPLAREIADELGYRLESVSIAAATMFPPPAEPVERWGPRIWKRSRYGPRVHHSRARELDEHLTLERGRGQLGSPVQGKSPSAPGSRESLQSVHEAPGSSSGPRSGTVGFAVLTRLEVIDVQRWDLGKRFGDPTHRSAIATEMTLRRSAQGGGGTTEDDRIVVVGTHLSHLRHGSISQVSRLRRRLDGHSRRPLAVVVAGDMNLPGPVMSMLMPGFDRAVRGRTWPAWNPIAQPDHILVRSSLSTSGEVLDIRGSDHLPVRVRLWTT